MENIKTPAIIGGILSTGYLIHHIIVAIRISKGIDFSEGLLPELINGSIVFSIFILPAFIILTGRKFKKYIHWLSWLYPLVLGFGILYLFTLAAGPLEAGMVFIIFILPFCIFFSLLLVFSKLKHQV